MTYLSEVLAWFDSKNAPLVQKMAWEAPDDVTFLRLVKDNYDAMKAIKKWRLVDWSKP